jgi:hypothetical protein
MAKAKTSNKKVSVANTIATEDHQKLQQYIGALEKLSKDIGGYEIQKMTLLSKQAQLQQQFNQFSAGLEHKYGKVSIDVTTGVYKTEEELIKEADGADKKD